MNQVGSKTDRNNGTFQMPDRNGARHRWSKIALEISHVLTSMVYLERTDYESLHVEEGRWIEPSLLEATGWMELGRMMPGRYFKHDLVDL